ncbi:MAG TPA: DUF523 domain-containing protein [Thermoanaerobacterales bacterium]|nr:DUF523 domain-containing protein [Thermoanaerobacterales bacterium]
MILISACLCGIDCKYNGLNNLDENIAGLVKKGLAIPFCPEQLGGLPTPRLPSEIVEGTGGDVLDGLAKVINKEGEDVTENFIRGAQQSLKLANMYGIKTAILKSKSPSCGYGEIYDGSFRRILIKGNGVTASLFDRNSIKVLTEKY